MQNTETVTLNGTVHTARVTPATAELIATGLRRTYPRGVVEIVAQAELDAWR